MKLRSIWDRRLVLSGTRKLSHEAEYKRRVYISLDELLDTPRTNTLERLKVRANRESKAFEVFVNGVLSIGGVKVFSLKDGYLNGRTRCPFSNEG